MIRHRVYALIDAVIEKVLERSKFRDPAYIRVNGRFVHIDEYAKMMGPPEAESP